MGSRSEGERKVGRAENGCCHGGEGKTYRRGPLLSLSGWGDRVESRRMDGGMRPSGGGKGGDHR